MKKQYCIDVVKNLFNKELAITKKDDEDLKNLVNARFAIIALLMVM